METQQISNLVHLSILDFVIIFLYFLILFVIGYISTKKTSKIFTKKHKLNSHTTIAFEVGGIVENPNISKVSKDKENEEKYILAGRTLTLPLFVATLVSTWYGSILGVGEYVYNSGIVAWISLGLPYYIAAFLYAMLFSKKIRNFNIETLPEQIENKFGFNSSIMTSILVLLMTLPGSYMLMLGFLLQLILGFNFYISLIIGSIISVSFIYKGGFKSDVYLNVFQFILMFVGFIILFIYAYDYFGSPIELYHSLPQKHQSLSGGLPFQVILVWFIIAFQTFIDPSFHQRCSAVKESKIAKNGILISILFWIIFDFMTLSCGLYAFKLLDLQTIGVSSVNAYPLLAEMLLPNILKGIFFVSLLATVMSTLESYSFLSAVTLGKDIIYRLFKSKPFVQKYSIEKIIQFSFILSVIASVILAIFIPSVIELMYRLSSLALPGLLVPVLITFTKFNISDKDATKLIIFPVFASGIVMLGNKLDIKLFNNIEAMIVGLIVSIFLSVYYLKFKYNT